MMSAPTLHRPTSRCVLAAAVVACQLMLQLQSAAAISCIGDGGESRGVSARSERCPSFVPERPGVTALSSNCTRGPPNHPPPPLARALSGCPSSVWRHDARAPSPRMLACLPRSPTAVQMPTVLCSLIVTLCGAASAVGVSRSNWLHRDGFTVFTSTCGSSRDQADFKQR